MLNSEKFSKLFPDQQLGRVVGERLRQPMVRTVSRVCSLFLEAVSRKGVSDNKELSSSAADADCGVPSTGTHRLTEIGVASFALRRCRSTPHESVELFALGLSTVSRHCAA